MSAEEKLVTFLKKLGVEDVMPLLKKGGVGSVKALYDRTFEEWRGMGISYGDCCYLDSSKPETIEDDEAIERVEKEKKEKEEREQKEKEAKERKAKEKAEKKERKRKAKEEKERLAKEEEERKERERKEQEEREEQERQKKEREEKEEQERQAKEKEEEERKQKEEEEEEERQRKAREKKEMRFKRKEAKKELERQEKEEREKEEREREQQEAQEKERLAKEEEEDRKKEQEQKEEEKEKSKASDIQKSPRRKASSPKLPSLSVGDLPVPKKHRKTLSARESDLGGSAILAGERPQSPRLGKSPRKKSPNPKDKKEKKKQKEAKENDREKDKEKGEFKMPRPIKKSSSTIEKTGSLRKSKKKKGHKKTLSTSFADKMVLSDGSGLTPSTKEDMLKKLSVMGNPSGGRKNSLLMLSPREQANIGRRNTVSELYPPEITAVTFIDKGPSKRVRRIIKCQAYVRGYLTRQFFQRWRVAHEILATEKSYVEDLDLILKTFVAPLEKKVSDNEPILDRNHIYYIFYNLREIHAEHQTILRLLYNRVYNKEEFMKKGLSDIFSNNVAKPLSHLYFPYVNNFAQSIKVLKKSKRDHKEFANFITKAEAKPELHLQDVESLLILPIQRVTRYSILLKSLLGKYKPNDPQYEELNEAYKIIRDRLNEINECKRDAENMAYVDEMLRSFIYEKGAKHIEFLAKRRFVREGTVYREYKHNAESKPIYFILFSDLLVIAKMRERKGGSTRGMVTKSYKVRDIITLSDISQVSLAHANEKECRSFVFHTAKKEYEYYLSTTEHCRSWTEIISSTLTKAVEMKNQSMRKKQGEKTPFQGLKKPEGAPSNSVSTIQKKDKQEEEFEYG